MRRLFLHELPANDDDGTDDYSPSDRSFQRECVRGKSSCDWQTNIHTKGDRKSCTRVEASPLNAMIRALETKELYTRTHSYRQYMTQWRHIRTYTRARANTHAHTHARARARVRVHKERKDERMTNERVLYEWLQTRDTRVHTKSVLRDPPNSHQTHCIKSSRVEDEARGRPTECSRVQIRANFDRVERDLNEWERC